MVEQRTLNPSVVVRIHLPQLRGREVGISNPSLFFVEYFAYLLHIESGLVVLLDVYDKINGWPTDFKSGI